MNKPMFHISIIHQHSFFNWLILKNSTLNYIKKSSKSSNLIYHLNNFDLNSEFYSKNPIADPSIKWKRGDYCIAKYTDKEFYRARIVETPEGKMKIYSSLFSMLSSSDENTWFIRCCLRRFWQLG
jgi:hypothetical protein